MEKRKQLPARQGGSCLRVKRVMGEPITNLQRMSTQNGEAIPRERSRPAMNRESAGGYFTAPRSMCRNGKLANLSATALRVMLSLRSRQWRMDEIIFPSQETIAQDVFGITACADRMASRRSQVSRAINELIDEGFVERLIEGRRNGKGNSTKYRLINVVSDDNINSSDNISAEDNIDSRVGQMLTPAHRMLAPAHSNVVSGATLRNLFTEPLTDTSYKPAAAPTDSVKSDAPANGIQRATLHADGSFSIGTVTIRPCYVDDPDFPDRRREEGRWARQWLRENFPAAEKYWQTLADLSTLCGRNNALKLSEPYAGEFSRGYHPFRSAKEALSRMAGFEVWNRPRGTHPMRMKEEEPACA